MALAEQSSITFEVADALRIPAPRKTSPSASTSIVCFEGLEHLPDLDAALERLRELAEGGIKMLLSVPNSKGLDEENAFHLTDFSWEEALARIGSFPGATALTQYLAEGSLICDGKRATAPTLARRSSLDDRNEPEYANHYLFASVSTCRGQTA